MAPPTNITLADIHATQQRIRDLLTHVAPLAAPEAVLDGAPESADEFTAPAPTTLERERLRRQDSLNLRLPRGVAIIGCGGVGSWIALMLALAGVQNLWLFDPDTVSEHNLNRLPLPPNSVGVGKSEALAQVLKVFRPSCASTPLKSFSIATACSICLDNEVSWLVCSTDTWASRKEAKSWADEASIRYIEAAAEGEMGSIADAPAEWATDQETQPGYQSVPVWVGPCVTAAMMAVAHVIHDTRPNNDLALRMGWSENGIEFFDSGALLRGVPPVTRDAQGFPILGAPVTRNAQGVLGGPAAHPPLRYPRWLDRLDNPFAAPETVTLAGTPPAPPGQTQEVWIVQVQSSGATTWSQSRNRTTRAMFHSEAEALAAISTRPVARHLIYRAHRIQ